MQRLAAFSRHWRRGRRSSGFASVVCGPRSLTDPLRRCSSASLLFSPSRMNVADLLEVSKQFRSKQTNYIHEDETLDDAVKCLMQNENSATLVVVNREHQVVGLITNRLALQRVAQMRSAGETTQWHTKVLYGGASACVTGLYLDVWWIWCSCCGRSVCCSIGIQRRWNGAAGLSRTASRG